MLIVVIIKLSETPGCAIVTMIKKELRPESWPEGVAATRVRSLVLVLKSHS